LGLRIIVFGAGGHSREIADLIVAVGHTVAVFQDDHFEGLHQPTGIPVVSNIDPSGYDCATCAIGDSRARESCWNKWSDVLDFQTLIHPSAWVSPYARIGVGTQVAQNVVVSSQAQIGVNVILNVGCVTAHDTVVGDHTHIAPGARLGGGAKVGSTTLVGTGAIVLPGVVVGSGCVIGAGAVVVNDVPDGHTAIGVPAR